MRRSEREPLTESLARKIYVTEMDDAKIHIRLMVGADKDLSLPWNPPIDLLVYTTPLSSPAQKPLPLDPAPVLAPPP